MFQKLLFFPAANEINMKEKALGTIALYSLAQEIIYRAVA
jgi:hypothetical protein